MTMDEIPGDVRTKTVEVHRQLAKAGIPHAFGGAIAFGYAGVPRATLDIDIDIFLPDSHGERVVKILSELGVEPIAEYSIDRLHRDAQTRMLWDGVFVDLFFTFDEFHEAVATRITKEDFEGHLIPVISAEDLVAFKLMFNRTKDWIDVESVLVTRGPAFDLEYLVGWLGRTIGADDSRIARLEELARETWERTDHIQ